MVTVSFAFAATGFIIGLFRLMCYVENSRQVAQQVGVLNSELRMLRAEIGDFVPPREELRGRRSLTDKRSQVVMQRRRDSGVVFR